MIYYIKMVLAGLFIGIAIPNFWRALALGTAILIALDAYGHRDE